MHAHRFKSLAPGCGTIAWLKSAASLYTVKIWCNIYDTIKGLPHLFWCDCHFHSIIYPGIAPMAWYPHFILSDEAGETHASFADYSVLETGD